MILSGASCPMGLASPLRVASRTCRVITDCAQELLATTEISAVNISKNRPILRTIASPLNGLAVEDVPFVWERRGGQPFCGRSVPPASADGERNSNSFRPPTATGRYHFASKLSGIIPEGAQLARH